MKDKMRAAAAFLVFILFQVSNGQIVCRDPNNRAGSCISIHSCPDILSLIQKRPLSDANRRFAQNSQCQNGAGRAPHVCCATKTNPTPTTTTTTTTTPKTSASGNGEGIVLPTLPRCGQAASGERIYSGNDTLLDEFAWMVLLEYNNNGKRSLSCGGSLINQRYVLTAAHCVTGAVLKEVGRLERVRLGEYDLSKDIDCFKKDCADPIVNMAVEESIPHPQYDDLSPNRQNDIALVRFNDVVTYTDFIKPVCLPSAKRTQMQLRTGTNLIVAGWGRTLTTRQSNIKQKLYIPVNDFRECVQKFAAQRVRLSSTQFCVGGLFIEDSCDGDSGGPLMSGEDATNYVIEGIVSFGNRCGLRGWPGVYTKVSEFEPWIRKTLRP